MNDRDYMALAIDLAKQGEGATNPNPMVGAVIVKDNKIIGRGFHEKYGQLHAERNALASCTESPEGACIYVTLEPCCHYGKTPPCTEAIIENKLKRVVIGSPDPNPLVSGKGVKQLLDAGIDVVEGFMRKECDAINPVFLHYITKKTPYVVMKYAMTMDGRIATCTGESKWITSEEARENVHRDRSRYMAIMTGVGTVIKDDPLLTCRTSGGRNPIRIICDTNLTTPIDSQLVSTTDIAPVIIATACTNKASQKPYIDNGCEVLEVPKGADSHLSLPALMKALGEKKIDSVFLEGGTTLNWSALSSGIVNKVQVYLAPKIFGGNGALPPIGGTGVKLPSDAFILSPPEIKTFGPDILLESEVISCSQE